MKTSEMQLTTRLSLNDIASEIKAFASAHKYVSIEKTVNDDPLGGFGGPDPDISLVVIGEITVAAQWAFQIHVYNNGENRSVDLIALGDDWKDTFSIGATNYYRNKYGGEKEKTTNLKTGQKKMEGLYYRLKNRALEIDEDENYRQQKEMWMNEGRCNICGGRYKGLLTKKCESCGNAK
ncbi:MAG: hypothetical protein IJ899_07190 [Blautia sp.]|nr:hypothetical protein [Blautia sp.]